MSAKDPSELHEYFAKFWNAKDIDGMLTLYEDDAVMVGQEGEDLRGKEAIRQMFEGFWAGGPGDITFTEARASVSGELALCHATWNMQMGEDTIEAKTAEVARRGSDGTWRYVLDNPYGTAILS